MDVFFYSVVIVGCIVFIKVLIVTCVYLCRSKRLRNRQLQIAESQTRDATLYPAAPYTQRSAFVNFEETPQPVMTVTPGECAQGVMPGMMPPPYAIATSADKPPAYTDLYKNSDQLDIQHHSIDTGHSAVETVGTAISPTPVATAPVAMVTDPVPIAIVTSPAPVAMVTSTDSTVSSPAPVVMVTNHTADDGTVSGVAAPTTSSNNHATVSPGGNIAVV